MFTLNFVWATGGEHIIMRRYRYFMIKFGIPSKENDEQFKSSLKNFYLLKICLVANMVQDELRVKVQEIIHNNLIMQWEDY